MGGVCQASGLYPWQVHWPEVGSLALALDEAVWLGSGLGPMAICGVPSHPGTYEESILGVEYLEALDNYVCSCPVWYMWQS